MRFHSASLHVTRNKVVREIFRHLYVIKSQTDQAISLFIDDAYQLNYPSLGH